MSETLILVTNFIRKRAEKLLRQCPTGWRVTFEEPLRTLSQNAKFHVLLDQFANQADHFGKRISGRTWKVLLMVELGHEIEYERSLDGSELVAIGTSTSKLKARHFSDLIELLFKIAAEKGVTLIEVDTKRRDPRREAA